jgi:hypothetical protein
LLGPNLEVVKSNFMNCNCQNDDEPNNDQSHKRPRCKILEASDFVSGVTGSHDIGWLMNNGTQASPTQICAHIALGSYTFGRDLPINISVSTTSVKIHENQLIRRQPSLPVVFAKKTDPRWGNGGYRIVATQAYLLTEFLIGAESNTRTTILVHRNVSR